jgi:hypothetical protein
MEGVGVSGEGCWGRGSVSSEEAACGALLDEAREYAALVESAEEEADLEPEFARWDEGRMLVGPGRPWQPHGVRRYPELRRLFVAVEAALGAEWLKHTRRRHRAKLRYLLRQTVINLYLCGLTGQGVNYYRSCDGYRPGTREHALHLTQHRMLWVMDALRGAGITIEMRRGERGKWPTTDALTPLGAELFYGQLPPRMLGRAERPQLDFIQVRSARERGTRRKHFAPPRLKAVREMRRLGQAMNAHNARFRVFLPVRLSELAALSQGRMVQLAQNVIGLVPELYRYHAEQASGTSTTECTVLSIPGGFTHPITCTECPFPFCSADTECPFSILRTDPEGQHRSGALPECLRWLRSQSGNEDELWVPVDLYAYRVFVLEHEDDLRHPARWRCGRLVAEYQVLPEEWRERLIYLDGDRVRRLHERDVVAMFVALTYNLEGLPMPADPYRLEGEYSPEALAAMGYEPKEVVKYPALIWLGARTKHSGSRAVRGYLEESLPKRLRKQGRLCLPLDANRVRRAIRHKHNRIAHRFGCYYGVRLMRVESDIAMEVVRRHLEAGQPGPILCVHDSFLAGDPDLLDELVHASYRDAFGGAFDCEVH